MPLIYTLPAASTATAPGKVEAAELMEVEPPSRLEKLSAEPSGDSDVTKPSWYDATPALIGFLSGKSVDAV